MKNKNRASFFILFILLMLFIIIPCDVALSNPGGVSNGFREPKCMSCHQMGDIDKSKDLRISINSDTFLSGEKIKLDLYSKEGDNNVRGAFITVLDEKVKNVNIKNRSELIQYLQNPIKNGFDFEKDNYNYQEQYYKYKEEKLSFIFNTPKVEQNDDFILFAVVAYGNNDNQEDITQNENAEYIISSPVKILVSPNPEYNTEEQKEDHDLADTNMQTFSKSLYNIESISNLINMNILAFIILTVSVMLLISEKFLKKKIAGVSDINTEQKTNGVYTAYQIIKQLTFYSALILILINIIFRKAWNSNLDKYIEIYSEYMLYGFIAMCTASVISFINLDIRDEIKNIIYKSLIIIGYLIYSAGLIFGIAIY